MQVHQRDAGAPEMLTSLGETDVKLISDADTFFVASYAKVNYRGYQVFHSDWGGLGGWIGRATVANTKRSGCATTTYLGDLW